MKQGKHVFYHILYADEQRINSLIAQIQFGLLKSITETQGVNHGDSMALGAGANGFLIKGEGNLTTTNGDCSQKTETYDPHHAKILSLLDNLHIDLESPTQNLPIHPDGRIDVVQGKLTINSMSVHREQISFAKQFVDFATHCKLPIEDLPDELSPEDIGPLLSIVGALQDTTRFSIQLKNSKVAGGTLDPQWLNSDHENPAFFSGDTLPLDWIVVGYCYPKTSHIPDSENPLTSLTSVMSSVASKFLGKDPDIIMIPILILR